MYDFIDRPVTSLDHGGRFLVWSMRSWVGTIRAGKCPASAIAPAFARWKMIAGLQAFHKAMLLFDRNALETLRFCALGCNRVAEHEAVVISLVCAMRDQRPQAVRDTLALLVEEEHVGEMIESLAALAGAMDRAAIFPARSAWQPGTTEGRR